MFAAAIALADPPVQAIPAPRPVPDARERVAVVWTMRCPACGEDVEAAQTAVLGDTPYGDDAFVVGPLSLSDTCVCTPLEVRP